MYNWVISANLENQNFILFDNNTYKFKHADYTLVMKLQRAKKIAENSDVALKEILSTVHGKKPSFKNK